MNFRDWAPPPKPVQFSLDDWPEAPELDAAEIERETGLELSLFFAVQQNG